MKVDFNGKQVEAKEMDVLSAEEHWNTYRLEDGTTLVLKSVLISVHRLEGEKNPDGSQVYRIQTSPPIIRVK